MSGERRAGLAGWWRGRGPPGWGLERPGGPCAPSSLACSAHLLLPWPHRERRGCLPGRLAAAPANLPAPRPAPGRMEPQALLKSGLKRDALHRHRAGNPCPREPGVWLWWRLCQAPQTQRRGLRAGQVRRPSCHRGFVSPSHLTPSARAARAQPGLQTGGASAAGCGGLHPEGGVPGARVLYVTEAVNGGDCPWQRELGQCLWGARSARSGGCLVILARP